MNPFVWLFRKLDPLAAPRARLQEWTEAAQEELAKQREGLRDEQRKRSDVEADIQRLILSAMRDVLRRRSARR